MQRNKSTKRLKLNRETLLSLTELYVVRGAGAARTQPQLTGPCGTILITCTTCATCATACVTVSINC
jgi:hypothetical protein